MKTKGKTKLEDLEVKKIDAVDIGADQKANILIKKRGGAEEPKGNFFKRFFNAFCDSLGVNSEDVRKSMEDEATSFDDVMSQFNEELDEITTLDGLKEFAKLKIDEGNYLLAGHIIAALQSGYDEDWWDYDYCMGTLDTPIPLTEKTDVEHLIND